MRLKAWLGETGIKTYFRCSRERSDRQKAWRTGLQPQNSHFCATSLIVSCAVQEDAMHYLVTIRLSTKHGSQPQLSHATDFVGTKPPECMVQQGVSPPGDGKTTDISATEEDVELEQCDTDAEDDELVEDMLLNPEDLGSIISRFFGPSDAAGVYVSLYTEEQTY